MRWFRWYAFFMALMATSVALVGACSLTRTVDKAAVPPPPPAGQPAASAPATRPADLMSTGAGTPPPQLLEMRAAMPNTAVQHGAYLSPRLLPPDWSAERYDFVQEEGFLSPASDPLSTFSIDVDTASYSNVRRFLRDGELPPKGAVRLEELINYFEYDYPDEPGGHPFSVTTELTQAPWAEDHLVLHVGIQGARLEERELPPRNLVFLIDVSGSMQGPDRLPLLQRALRELVVRLRPEDRVAMVVYAGASGLVLPPTSGSESGRILDALEGLRAGGSTNGGQGIVLAYEVARRNFEPGAINRVILATDGDFNVGVTSRSELVELIEKQRESGVFLSVLAVGRGNLNDAQLEQLADHGNGNYA